MKEVKIELTEHCNRWCKHCSSKAKNTDYKSLDIDTVKRIIDEAKEIDIKSVVLTGGEATLYPKLDEVISYANNNGLDIKLYSMCDPTLENIQYLGYLNTIGLKEIIYSTTYNLTLDGVITLDKLKQFFPLLLDKTNIRLGFHHAILKDTLYDIDEVIKLFFSLDSVKTTNLSFLRYVPHGRGTKSLLLDRNELIWFRNKMIEYKKIYGEKIRLGSPWNFLGIEKTECSAAEKSLIVGFDGNVYPCDAMKYFDYLGSGGNIYHNSLKEIYNSKYFNDIRTLKYCSNLECLNCPNYEMCKGGCLGQKMVAFISPDNFTFREYGILARRTMNNFDTEEIKKMNGEMGIIGEIGELIDTFKKYKTHNLNNDSRNILKDNLIIEIGDIVWYLAASLSSYYNIRFEDIGKYIQNNTEKESDKQIIDTPILLQSIKTKDPECLFKAQNDEIYINILDNNIVNYNFDNEWKKLVYYSYQIIYIDDENKLIEILANLLLTLSKIANIELEVSMNEVLKRNIDKLNNRYEQGYSREVANKRIKLLSSYKKSEATRKE